MRKIGIKVVIAVFLVALMSSAAVATLIIQRNISLTMTIIPVLGMQVFNTDGSTPLTAVALGDFHRGDTKRFPAVETEFYYVKNTGETNIWIKYDIGTLISGCVVSVYLDGVKLTKTAIYATPLTPATPGQMYFTIEVTGSASFGTFNTMKLEFYAYDTASG